MRLEYFQMIDRVTALDAVARTIVCESRVPDDKPRVRGPFPAIPSCPASS